MLLNNLPRLFLGPMSCNVIDSVCSYKIPLGFVASRRQIEFSGGYVEDLTPYSFYSYVKKLNKSVIIERDHAGPMQGLVSDDGKNSLFFDTKYFDIVHIDVWKNYKGLSIAALKTAEYIRFCENINPGYYEVGTEQDIRQYTPSELYIFLKILQDDLQDLFDKIIYVVIQCGTSLKGSLNKGIFNENRLKEMVEICRYFGKKSKEHNGDYQHPDLINQKFLLGLDAINIAPELGRIETQVVIETLKEDIKLESFFKICFFSNKWQRWLGDNFDGNKINLIEVCGHYVFSNKLFKELINDVKKDIKEETEKRIHDFIKKIL